MKTTVFLVACVLMATVAMAQNQKINEIEVTAPKFQNELYQSANEFLSGNVEYPREAKNAGLQGTSVIRFTVSTDGTLKNYKITNSVSPHCDQEVIRILAATSGKWKAGTTNGQPAEMQTEASVVFCLRSPADMINKANRYHKKGNEYMYIKNNPEKALKYFNRGIVLLPHEEIILAMRGLCHYQLGNEQKANTDWNRVKQLAQKNGNVNVFEKLADIDQNTAGYEELIMTLNR